MKKIAMVGVDILLAHSCTGKSRIQMILDTESERLSEMSKSERPPVSIVVAEDFNVGQIIVRILAMNSTPVIIVDSLAQKEEIEEFGLDKVREKILSNHLNTPETMKISRLEVPDIEYAPSVRLHEIPNDFSKFRGTSKGHNRKRRR